MNSFEKRTLRIDVTKIHKKTQVKTDHAHLVNS